MNRHEGGVWQLAQCFCIFIWLQMYFLFCHIRRNLSLWVFCVITSNTNLSKILGNLRTQTWTSFWQRPSQVWKISFEFLVAFFHNAADKQTSAGFIKMLKSSISHRGGEGQVAFAITSHFHLLCVIYRKTKSQSLTDLELHSKEVMMMIFFLPYI